MNQIDRWPRDLMRPDRPRSETLSKTLRWAAFGKALLAIGAVLALMSAVLYAETRLPQEYLMEETMAAGG